MHTIASAPSDHLTGASTMAVDSSVSGDPSGMVASSRAEASVECGGMCDAGTVMANMACVLALLFFALVIAIAASRLWSTYIPSLRRQWLAIVAVAVAAMPPPPDLNALSISRT